MNPWQGLTGEVIRPRAAYTIKPERKRKPAPRPVRDNPWDLSSAECRVLDMLIKNGGNDESAAMLGLSTITVEMHLRSARKKMCVENRVMQALAWDRYLSQRAVPIHGD